MSAKTRREMPVWRWIAPLWLLAATSSGAAPADDIKTLVEQGRHQDAWRLGAGVSGEAGKPAFDFYFGIAAINAGKISEGVFALERFLLNFPENITARLELARGYYLLNDDARARDEFEAVLAAKPADEVARTVREYLGALAAREARHKTSYGFSVEIGGGRDSNVQSGVADANITLPVFGPITLAAGAVGSGDRFANVTLAGRVTVPVRPGWGAFLQTAIDSRQYRDADPYNQNSYSAATGLQFTAGEALYRISLGRTAQTLDNQRYRDTWALGVDLGYQLSGAGVLTLVTQAAKFDYSGANAIRDADYAALQAGYRHQFTGGWRPDAELGLSAAREKNTAGGHEDLSRDLWGGRIGFGFSPLAAWTLGLGASYLKSRYRSEDPLLLVTRQDEYTTVDLGLTYALSSAWSLRGEYQAARNKSNLPLYEYKRRVGQFKLRYDFR